MYTPSPRRRVVVRRARRQRCSKSAPSPTVNKRCLCSTKDKHRFAKKHHAEDERDIGSTARQMHATRSKLYGSRKDNISGITSTSSATKGTAVCSGAILLSLLSALLLF